MKPRIIQRRRRLQVAKSQVAANIALVVYKQFGVAWRAVYPGLRRLKKVAVENLDDIDPIMDPSNKAAWQEWVTQFDEAIDDALVEGAGIIGNVDLDFWQSRGLQHLEYDPVTIVHRYKEMIGRRDGREIKDIAEQTAEDTANAIDEWMGNDLSFQDLVDKLSQWFTPSRAAVIAQTETTWLGSVISDDMMDRLGSNEWVWDSLNDWLVCNPQSQPHAAEWCSELHGKTFQRGDPMPPLHPGCRCNADILDPGAENIYPVPAFAGQAVKSMTHEEFIEGHYVDKFLDALAGKKLAKDFDEGQHPRGPDGKFIPAGGGAAGGEGGAAAGAGQPHLTPAEAERLKQALLSDAEKHGFSYNPVTARSPTSGLSVSIHEDRTQLLNRDEITVPNLQAYVDKNGDLLSQPGKNFGGWLDTESGATFLDVSQVVNTDAEAHDYCLKYHQKAYFNLATKQEVRVDPNDAYIDPNFNKLAPELAVVARPVRFQMPPDPTREELQQLVDFLLRQSAPGAR